MFRRIFVRFEHVCPCQCVRLFICSTVAEYNLTKESIRRCYTFIWLYQCALSHSLYVVRFALARSCVKCTQHFGNNDSNNNNHGKCVTLLNLMISFRSVCSADENRIFLYPIQMRMLNRWWIYVQKQLNKIRSNLNYVAQISVMCFDVFFE